MPSNGPLEQTVDVIDDRRLVEYRLFSERMPSKLAAGDGEEAGRKV